MAKVRLVTQATTDTPEVGTYPNRTPTYWDSGTFLWNYFRPVPAQNSILIYADGTVEEVQVPPEYVIKTIPVFIQGGHQFVTETGSFAYNSLVAAGYTFEAVA